MRRIRRGGGKENAAASPPAAAAAPEPAAAPTGTGVLTLRKELADATDGRAEMELEYMNLLSTIESEKRATDELLETRTRERDGLRRSVEGLRAEVKELRSRVDNERDEHRREADRLRCDLEGTRALLDERDDQLDSARATLTTAAKRNGGSSLSQQEAALMREQVEGAAKRLDEETTRFEKEANSLRRQRDEARKKAQHEEASGAQSRAAAADLQAQVVARDQEIEALKVALAKKEESSVSQQEAALLREQVEGAMRRLDEETIRFQKEKESLRRQRDEAEKKALREEASFAQSQSASAELQARIVVKDQEIESLKGTLAKSREYSDSLKTEVKDLGRQLEREAERADNLSQEIEAIQMARSLNRSQSPTSIEIALEREKQHAADREEIDRLNAAAAERDAKIGERDAEIESLQSSLQDSIEQSETLIGEIRRLKKVGAASKSEGDAEKEERRDKELRELRARVSESDAQLESFERSAAEANVRSGQLEAELEDLRAQLDTDASRGSAHKDRLEVEIRKADELREQLEKKREENQRLRGDLEELCESMKDLALARREEMGEVQSQMSRKSNELDMKDKEIQLLKLSLREEFLKHRNEMDQCKAKIRALEQQPVQESAVERYEAQIEELNRKNSHLRSQLASHSVEVDKLKKRVQTLIHAAGDSRTVDVLRSRNEALKQEAEKWRRRYDGLENSIKRVSV